MINIVHITHTDIRNDWRIRKQLIHLNSNLCYSVKAYGIESFTGIDFPDDGVNSYNVSNVKFSNKIINTVSIVFSCLSLFRLLLKHDEIAVLHCHDTPALAIGVLYRVLKGKTTKVIYDAHELESDKGGQNKLFAWVTRLLERICAKWVDGFITVSEAILSWYLNKFEFPKYATIYNTPNYTSSDNLSILAEDVRHNLRSKYAIPEAAKIFFTSGS